MNIAQKFMAIWSEITFKEETNTEWIFIKQRLHTKTNKAVKTSSIFHSYCPSLSGVWMQGGGLAGCQTRADMGVCVFVYVFGGGLVAWHSYIPERTEQTQTAGWEPADQLLCERFSLPSSQNNWWWPTQWPFNPPLLSQSSKVTIWTQIFVQAVWAIAVSYTLLYYSPVTWSLMPPQHISFLKRHTAHWIRSSLYWHKAAVLNAITSLNWCY